MRRKRGDERFRLRAAVLLTAVFFLKECVFGWDCAGVSKPGARELANAARTTPTIRYGRNTTALIIFYFDESWMLKLVPKAYVSYFAADHSLPNPQMSSRTASAVRDLTSA